MPIKSLAVILALLMCTMFMAAGCYDDKASSSSAASSSSSSSIDSLEYPGSIRTALILLVRCLYDPADAKEIEATRKAAETMLMPYRTGLGA